MHFVPSVILVLAVATASLAAQNLVALTDRSPLVAKLTLSGSGCKATACSARAANIGARVAARAGGIAWDGRTGRVWASNGLTLGALNVRPTNLSCAVACKPIAAPLPGTGTRFVTGMTIVEAGAQPKPGVPGPTSHLFLSYSNQMLGRVTVKGCRLGTPMYCSMLRTLGSRRIIGGLASDDPAGLLFVATSSSVATSPANVVYVTRTSAPCAPICKFAPTIDQTKCANVRLGPIVGAAFDACSRTIFLTDGRLTMFGTLTVSTAAPYSCRFVHKGCCVNPTQEVFTGLARAPLAPEALGHVCTNGSCLSCAKMVSGIVGDPVLGNGAFAFTLSHAPGNFRAGLLAVGFGPCRAPGLNLGFCANITIALAPFRPLTLGFTNPRPTTSCNGEVRIAVPIPNQRSICGLPLSTQWILACPQGGTGVSRCLSMRLQGL